MNELESRNIQCPYCGELIDILIDCSIENQNYIEEELLKLVEKKVSVSLKDVKQVFRTKDPSSF